MGRSRAKRPTLKQKKLIADAGLKVDTWLVIHEDDAELQLVSRGAGKPRRIKKAPRRQA